MIGCLNKMQTHWANPVQYQLVLNQHSINLNALIGQTIRFRYTGQIFCQHCNLLTKQSFSQGYCFFCANRLARCDVCMIKPELCHYAYGTCREPEWAQDFCFQHHIVYLANSSGLKVGITRETQLPTRWIDQGAIQGLPIIKTNSRYLAGLIEVIFAQYLNDKTSWQTMLKHKIPMLNLMQYRDELLTRCLFELEELKNSAENHQFEVLNFDQNTIDFPVHVAPQKVKSFNFDKTNEVSGILQGIKGQYLIFDSGVINVRKFSGYEVEFSVL